jgi:hypothetical protein
MQMKSPALFEQIELMEQMLEYAQSVPHLWHQVRSMTQQHNSTTTCHWQPPPVDFAKCNLDTSVFTTEQKGGMGACLRDNNNNFILAMTTHN